MATVHLGRLLGPVGFSRTVAIKRLHAQFASDPEFVSMFLDEARLAARIRHPNVVPTLDVVATQGELFLVMEYVPGESVARLARALRDQQQQFPLRILSGIMTGVLHGLHAAHEAKDERGHPLGIVHRDVSPQNVLVGTDGVPRVLDFGVAKAAGRMQTTKEGQIKGKLSYMPPEQLKGATVNRQTDIYAAGVMLWELVAGQRLFAGENEGAIVAKVLEGCVQRPSEVIAGGKRTLTDAVLRQIEVLDETILHALAMNPSNRFATAREMALEIERKCPPATASEIGDWVEHIAKDVLHSRAAMIAEIESSTSTLASAEGRENHVMSVLNAGSRPPGPEGMIPIDVTRTAVGGSGGLTPRSAVSGVVPQVDGPPVTQPSSISVSSAQRLEDDRGGRRTAMAVGVGVLFGASLLASVLVYKQSYTKAHTVPTTEPTTAIGSNTVLAADAGSGDTTLGGASGAATGSASATTSAVSTWAAPTSTAGSGAATAPRWKPKPASNPAPPPPVATAKPPEKPTPAEDNCNPPFWYDAQGVKHYKPLCVK